ncbi:hypothetical protein EDD85DRAFT_741641, partial [Armillaria nabsnona]
MCVTGLSVHHVGERFQHSNETISRYFKTILFALSSPNFYRKYVHLPLPDSTPAFIHSNPEFWPFFAGALGAIDGTHITCFPSTLECHAARNCK